MLTLIQQFKKLNENYVPCSVQRILQFKHISIQCYTGVCSLVYLGTQTDKGRNRQLIQMFRGRQDRVDQCTQESNRPDCREALFGDYQWT